MADETKSKNQTTNVSHVPIVDVFSEDEKTQSMSPAHRPVVVEIEDVLSQTEEPLEPPTPTYQPQPEVAHDLPPFFKQDLSVEPAVVPPVPERPKSPKRTVALILLILALLLLGAGGVVWYTRSIFAPVTLPQETPTPMPSIEPIMTPAPVASDSAVASASALLKGKVKVDVLNGTKVAGLASTNASILKTAGYVMGRVGNGESAGTIVYDPQYEVLAKDIQKLLTKFTFTLNPVAGEKTIVVTLGE